MVTTMVLVLSRDLKFLRHRTHFCFGTESFQRVYQKRAGKHWPKMDPLPKHIEIAILILGQRRPDLARYQANTVDVYKGAIVYRYDPLIS